MAEQTKGVNGPDESDAADPVSVAKLHGSVWSGVRWSTWGQLIGEVIGVFTSVALARLLAPTEFGTMALAGTFARFLSVIQYLGTTGVVIQRKQVTSELLDALFIVNVIISSCITLIVWFSAPIVGQLMDQEQIVPVLRALSIVFAVSACSAVPNALLNRQMNFSVLVMANVVAATLQGVVGVLLAFMGRGVWSLVFSFATFTVVSTGVMWWKAGWAPRFKPAWGEFKASSPMMWQLTGSNLLSSFVTESDKFIVGRWLQAGKLGIYSMATRFGLYAPNSVAPLVTTVLLPAYSKIQDSDAELRDLFWKATSVLAFVTIPMTIGIALISDQFVKTILGPRWIDVRWPLVLMCAAGFARCIVAPAGNVFIAKGRAGQLLSLNIVRGLLTISLLLLGLSWGLLGVCIAYVIVSFVMAGITFALYCRLTKDSFAGIVPAVGRPLLYSSAMALAVGAVILFLSERIGSGVPLLSVLVLTGIGAYSIIAWALGSKELSQVMSILKMSKRTKTSSLA